MPALLPKIAGPIPTGVSMPIPTGTRSSTAPIPSGGTMPAGTGTGAGTNPAPGAGTTNSQDPFTIGNVQTPYNGSNYIASVVYNKDGSTYSPAGTISSGDPKYNEYQAWLKADAWNKSQRDTIDATQKTADTGASTGTDPYQPNPNYQGGFPSGGGGGGGGGGGFSYTIPDDPGTGTAAAPMGIKGWYQAHKTWAWIGIAVVVVIIGIILYHHRKGIKKTIKKL